MIEFDNFYAVLVYSWACGFVFHIAIHFVIIVTAPKLWNFGLGADSKEGI